jgi:uridine kinase
MGSFLSYSDCNLKKHLLKQRFPKILTDLEAVSLRNIKDLKTLKKPYIITFTGASSSGKTYLAKLLASILSEQVPVSYFSQDNYYRDFNKDFSDKYSLSEFYETINFDDPQHFRFAKLKQDLLHIKKASIGGSIDIPKITFGTGKDFPFIEEKGLNIPITPVLITEGVYTLVDPEVHPVYDFKFFINMENDTRKNIWIERNTKENRYFNDHMWETTVESLNSHILPSKVHADMVIDNTLLSSDCEKLFRDLFLNPFR